MPVPTQRPEIESELDVENLDAHRVLVVGANPAVEAVRSVQWDELADSGISIADFSLVVLALESFDLTDGNQIARIRNTLNQRYQRLLQGPATELTMIGRGTNTDSFFADFNLGLGIVGDQGDFVTDRDPEFDTYLQLVNQYAWILRPVDVGRPLYWSPLIRAAGRDPLGVAIRADDESRVVVLPAPTDSDLDDGISTLLVHHYGLSGGAREAPNWLDSVTMPVEQDLRATLTSLDAQIGPLVEARDEAEADLAEARRFLAALYETGSALEDVVRDILRELGASVTDPENQQTDDGTLQTPAGDMVVLEIKGRQGPIRVADARQLSDWVNDRTFVDDHSSPAEWKGLLIGNTFSHTPLEERGEDPFAPNSVRVAERDGHALITASQLIDAMRRKQSGDFDPPTWWRQVVDTNGVFDLPDD